ncbi:hypothetical protein [Cerasicoccus fimbriatus]|uniref:hypothetical protein n=1 Tax=Cerasicoccus fimbriatus TaxID=3014554 RepID=UPI0022B3F8FC|nr:hypothetical protein [Cerasicoccus sp. TK19100]
MSLYSLECSLVKLDELTDDQIHNRDAWETFIDNGRARREILNFAIREAKESLDDQAMKSVASHIPEKKFLSTDRTKTIARFQLVYREVLKDCEALGDQRLARKLRLAESLIPRAESGATHIIEAPDTPLSKEPRLEQLKIA